jgi:phosphate-selective porin OprO/OprP
MPPAVPAPSDSARIDRLEKELADTKDELSRVKAYQESHPGGGGANTAAAQGEKFERLFGKDAFVTWNNGFSLMFLDDKEEDPERRVLHQFHMGGRLQADFREYQDKDYPQNDRFFLRRARLAAYGTFWKYFDFVSEVDFGSSQAGLREGYINIGFWREFQFRMGQTKEPFMLEHMGSDLYLNFIERSMMWGVANVDFDMGAMVHGDLGYGIYQAGFFNGTSTNTIDNNDDKDFDARIMLTPFRPAGEGPLETLIFGGAFNYGHEDNFVPAYRVEGNVGGTTGSNFGTTPGGIAAPFGQPSAGAEAGTLASNANNVAGGNTDKFLVFPALTTGGTGRFQRGPRSRWDLEFRYEFTPVVLEAEYSEMEIDSILGPGGVKSGLGTRAAYVDVLYMITGESYPYSRRIIPKRNFNPSEGGWGAWQLAARWDLMQVDGNDVLKLGGVGATHVNAMVLGVNWYMNPLFKFQFNYERDFFNRPAANTGRDADDIFMFRLAMEF